jgi:prophage regulatory protein
MNKKPVSDPEPPAPPALPSPPSADRVAFVRRKQVQALMGPGRSTIYNRIQSGLMTRPISLGGRIVGWPESEIFALNRARIRGWSDDQIRALVVELEAARSTFAGGL